MNANPIVFRDLNGAEIKKGSLLLFKVTHRDPSLGVVWQIRRVTGFETPNAANPRIVLDGPDRNVIANGHTWASSTETIDYRSPAIRERFLIVLDPGHLPDIILPHEQNGPILA